MKKDLNLSEEIFRQKLLRDVLAVVETPLLIDEGSARALQDHLRYSVLNFLGRYPGRLERMIAHPEPRLPLGKWFERVFFAVLHIAFPFGEVAHSVSDGAGGELDFVVSEGRNLMHIECAIKFFLHNHLLGNGLESYVGPAGRDRLDLKLKKMRDVQLMRSVPQATVYSNSLKRVLWMSGRVHYRCKLGELIVPGTVPTDLMRGHLVGFYGAYEDIFPRLREDTVLYELPRPWWMTSLDGFPIEFMNFFDVFDHVILRSEPVMVVHVKHHTHGICELERGWVI